ncbi:hypothetical protein [Burkholderia thailandensis]|uniref:hypothetical protein n=1 Tax=Burkholderia thailandensis TaxID=57975 RepID=UPI00107E93F9|nr:hypothetical protein [Burkholderia thailandensis]TGB34384.1 hypothetical protein C6946_07085 [Burkholderia thailandensis]
MKPFFPSQNFAMAYIAEMAEHFFANQRDLLEQEYRHAQLKSRGQKPVASKQSYEKRLRARFDEKRRTK